MKEETEIALKDLQLNGVMRVFQLEALLDSDAPQRGVLPWQRLIEEIFRPKSGEKLRESTKGVMRLGGRSDVPTKEIESSLRSIVETTERELNLISERFHLGASVKMVLVVKDNVECQWLISLDEKYIESIVSYRDLLHRRTDEILKHAYLKALIKNLDLIAQNILLRFFLDCTKNFTMGSA